MSASCKAPRRPLRCSRCCPRWTTSVCRTALVRPLTARSVVASTLLGTEPPRLPVSFLVRTGELFGLAEGTVRTALSRMVAAGEVITEGDGWYALGGELMRAPVTPTRAGVTPPTVPWSGQLGDGRRDLGRPPRGERAELRTALARQRLGELREGVWLRPDNLDRGPTGSSGCLGSSQICPTERPPVRARRTRDHRARATAVRRWRATLGTSGGGAPRADSSGERWRPCSTASTTATPRRWPPASSSQRRCCATSSPIRSCRPSSDPRTGPAMRCAPTTTATTSPTAGCSRRGRARRNPPT